MDENNNGISSPFSILPEDCISNIIYLMKSPKDAGRASVISFGFKSASESDNIWAQFLPSDYREILSKSVSPPLNYSTKKELFSHLCRSPILVNDGSLSFWLSKSSGKKCYMLCARKLSIIWADVPRYWIWTSIRESRFSEVVELIDVCWLKIRGQMQTQMLSQKTCYAVYLVFKTRERWYGLETVAKASIGFVGGSGGTSFVFYQKNNSVYLNPPTDSHNHQSVEQQIDGRVPHQRNDGWLEIFLGEFYNDEGDGDIEFHLWETEVLNWKRGLIIEGIELRPMDDV
ncbi:hypothetical protein ACH5RR_032753 [Cinchona calisaya]|uniref:F-box domain-containing protein n=1 Tax=Cinchona calisaya TaxID=153742 RepID=A0ABD2YL15_9GENT